MERCDRIVLDVNVSCAYLWKKCLQLFSIHTLSECDATPYPYGKGNITVLNNLFVRDYLCLVNVLCEGSIKHANNLEAGKPFCIALYDNRPSWSQRRTYLKSRPCHQLLPICFST